MELRLKTYIRGPYRIDSYGCWDILPRFSFKNEGLIPPVTGSVISRQPPVVSLFKKLKRVA